VSLPQSCPVGSAVARSARHDTSSALLIRSRSACFASGQDAFCSCRSSACKAAIGQGGRPGVVALGLLFFGLFPVLFNASLALTTAARGALALSTLPLLTMLTAALLGVERLSRRKSVGVFIAMTGVATALVLGLADAPEKAWQGDLLMVAAAFCMALYNVWSRPFIRRSSPITFTTMGMGAGAVCLGLASATQGRISSALHFGIEQWVSTLYLGIFGGALTFWLWAYALRHTTPTRVAISVTVNPIVAAIVGALLLDEPVHWNLGLGMIMVGAGIGMAVSDRASGALPARYRRPSGGSAVVMKGSQTATRQR
jgi:drug/metabolite transporter (DMT)-like permease